MGHCHIHAFCVSRKYKSYNSSYLHSLMAIAVSIGAAGIPGAGVMILIVLQAVNLPLHDFGVILAVEWLL